MAFSTNNTGTTGYPHARKKKNLDTDFTTKWITDINMKHKMIKLLEDNIGKKSR